MSVPLFLRTWGVSQLPAHLQHLYLRNGQLGLPGDVSRGSEQEHGGSKTAWASVPAPFDLLTACLLTISVNNFLRSTFPNVFVVFVVGLWPLLIGSSPLSHTFRRFLLQETI